MTGSENAAAQAAEQENQDDPGEYTHAVLCEMRKLGLAKPVQVSEARWLAAVPPPLPLSLRERIAKELAANPPAKGDKSVFGHIFPKAIDLVCEIMENEGESGKTRLQAATYVADQFSGKAGQQVEISGTVVHDFRAAARQFEQLKEAQLLQLRDVSATVAEPIDKNQSIVDSFLTTHVGTADFSVGKRGTIGEEPEQEP